MPTEFYFGKYTEEQNNVIPKSWRRYSTLDYAMLPVAYKAIKMHNELSDIEIRIIEDMIKQKLILIVEEDIETKDLLSFKNLLDSITKYYNGKYTYDIMQDIGKLNIDGIAQTLKYYDSIYKLSWADVLKSITNTEQAINTLLNTVNLCNEIISIYTELFVNHEQDK